MGRLPVHRDNSRAPVGRDLVGPCVPSIDRQNRSKPRLNRLEAHPTLADWVNFFSEVGAGEWMLAGTVTLREFNPISEKRRHPDADVAVAKQLLARVNKAAFNHRAKRHGATVASMMILGNNAIGEATHIHFAFGMPQHMNYAEFVGLVEQVISKLYWCNQEFDLKPCRDNGWLNYCLAHGTEKLIIECCCKARS